jgi:amidase
MLQEQAVDYANASAGELARALVERQVSAVELFDAAVRAIEGGDGPINAVVVRDFDRALAAAKAADASLARGERQPLLGVPMTVKESHNVAGLPTTWGLAPFKDWTPGADSTGVARLKGAGAVILGKTNVPPNLGDWQAANPIYGRTVNPHDLSRSPGGSSGGAAAALTSGMVPLEFGSDIGGSIRVPAHFCGVYGHKPTYDLVPMTGHAPPTVERPGAGVEFGVVGPLARTAADLELALGVLAGPEADQAVGYRLGPPAPRVASLKEARVLVLTDNPVCATDAEVARPIEALGDRLAALGATVAHESDALPDLAAGHAVYLSMLGAIMSRGAPDARTPMDAHAWMNGLDAIASYRHAWAELFADFDVVLAPPFGTPAFPHKTETDWAARRLVVNGLETPYGAQIAWPGLATFPGLPATCAPLVRTASGLPTGVQIIGPRFEDLTPIAFAGLLAKELGYAALRP